MTINPYEPPQEALQGAGPWRHGEFLVVPTDRPPSFPLRCIGSGAPVPATSKIQTEACFPERSIFQKSITLICPVDHQTVPAVRLIDVVSRSIMIVAGLLCLVHVAMVNVENATYRLAGVRAMTLVFALIVTSTFLQCLFVRRLLTLRKIKGQYAWIVGAHPDFLKDLPPWPGLPHE